MENNCPCDPCTSNTVDPEPCTTRDDDVLLEADIKSDPVITASPANGKPAAGLVSNVVTLVLNPPLASVNEPDMPAAVNDDGRFDKADPSPLKVVASI